MGKEIRRFIVTLLVGGLALASGIKFILTEARFDLNKSSILQGKVTYSTIDTRSRFSVRFDITQKIFWFTLQNSSEKFTIHLPSGGYGYLSDNIRPGDTIKVYYKSGSAGFNMNVFQVEKAGLVLYDHRSYISRISTGGGLLLIFGILCIAFGIIQYTKFNLWRFLLRLTQ